MDVLIDFRMGRLWIWLGGLMSVCSDCGCGYVNGPVDVQVTDVVMRKNERMRRLWM